MPNGLCVLVLKHKQPSNEDICFHMVLDTLDQKFDVILSKLVHGCQTAWHPLIGSDKPVTALR